VILSGRFWSQLIKTHQPISGKNYQQQFTRPVSLKWRIQVASAIGKVGNGPGAV
jgi:hypothetical protein